MRRQPERLAVDAPPPAIKMEPGLASNAPPPAPKSSIDPPALTVDHAVWAKVKGFPWWPARVQEVSGQTVTVFFFGTEQLGKVRAAPSSCVPFSARPAGAVVAAGKRGHSGYDAFVEAVAQAEAYDVRAGLGLTGGESGHVEVVAIECTEAVEDSGEEEIEVTVEEHPGLQKAGGIGVGSRVQDTEGICGEIVETNMAWVTMRTDAGEERKMRKMALKLVAPGPEAAPADQVAAAAKKSSEGKQRKRSSCPFTSARGKKSKKSKSREPVMSSEEAQLIASIRAGTQEYHHQGFGPDGEAYYELEDVDDEPFRDECDVCKATPSPSQRWFKCVHCIGFDLCEDCHANPTVPRHPHPLVRRPAAIEGTEAPRVSSRLTPGGGGVLVSLQVAPAGADGAASRSALRDLRLLEGLWSCRFHVKKLAATSECREDELQGLIEGALRPHASHGCNATGAPTLVLTRVEEAALKETVAGRSGKKKQMSKAQAAGAEAAAKFFKGFKCADAVRDDELWLRAMQEATTLLQHSNSSEQLPLSLRHALPPLQHGTNWDHGEDGFPGARNAASAKLLREVQEPPVTPLLLVPPAHLRAPMDIMKKTGALLTGGCAPLTGHKWNGALVCKPEVQ